MDIVKKLQNQPEYIRKIILWLIVIIIGLSLLVWWVKSFSQKLKEFEKEEFIGGLNLPSLDEQLQKLPEAEVPQDLGGELERLEEGIEGEEEEEENGGAE